MILSSIKYTRPSDDVNKVGFLNEELLYFLKSDSSLAIPGRVVGMLINLTASVESTNILMVCLDVETFKILP